MSLHEQQKRKDQNSLKYAFIVVMGVSGTGKSTLGSALARRLDMPYVEGDDLHPRSNIAKMSAGIPLTDQDREPWLKLIRSTAEHMTIERKARSSSSSSSSLPSPLSSTLPSESGSAAAPSSARLHRDGLQVNGEASVVYGVEGDGEVAGVVISCSALKRYYRDILRGKLDPPTSASSPSTSTSTSTPITITSSSVLGHPSPSDASARLRTFFIFIDGRQEVLLERMEKRPGHFMKASMLDSQLATLESPVGEEGVVVVSLESSTEEQVRTALEGLRSMPEFPRIRNCDVGGASESLH